MPAVNFLAPRFDETSRQVANLSKPTLDVALVPTKRPGRSTWKWDAKGDLVFDDSQAYAVLVSIVARKGQYRWDRSFGTLLGLTRQERTATGSRLTAYARDGLAACEADRVIATGSTVRVDKVGPGSWRVVPSWTSAGKSQKKEVRL